MNLVEEILIKNTNINGSKIAVIFEDESISRSQLVEDLEKMALFLEKQGISPDDRVLLLLNDTPMFFLAFLGTIAMGAIPVPINPKTSIETLEKMLEDSRARGVFMESENLETYGSVIQKSKYLNDQHIFIQNKYGSFKDFQSFVSIKDINLKEYDNSSFKYYQKKSNSVSFWQYTSGTTGFPKAVLHSQETMLLNTQLFAINTIKINENDVVLSIPKMFFGYALGNSLFFPLISGATVILDASWFNVDVVLSLIKKHKPTILWAGPKIYQIFLKQENTLDKTIFDCINIYFSAGADMPAALNKRWHQSFKKYVRNGIGATEMGHVFMTTTQDEEIYSTGKVVNGYSIKLCDNEGIEVENSQGELWIKPPYKPLGYWENDNANTQKFRDGWYKSGDLFQKNEDNTYSYVGRADDLFKVNGRWVVPLELENYILGECKDLDEVAVVGCKNHEQEIEPVMFLVTKNNTPELLENIKNLLINKYERYKIPVKYIILDLLPKNENGKLLRNKLIEMS